MKTIVHITGVMLGVALTIVPGMASPQDAPDSLGSTVDVSTDSVANTTMTESGLALRTTLSEEMNRLKSDIEDMRRLMRWQEDLMRAARADRAEALRQRRPHRECLESVLVLICDDLSGLFFPPDTTPNTTDNTP